MAPIAVVAAPEHMPPIVIAEEQFDALSDIAERLAGVLPEVADFLERELARARLLPMNHVPPNVVTMNATVEFIFGMKGRTERLTLVYPAEDASGSVSIASPVGVALLGLSEGQSISWSSRYGELRWLKVKKVERPAPERPTPERPA